jgi:uncharacterized membrane protein
MPRATSWGGSGYGDGSGTSHGFLWQKGTFTTIDPPDAVFTIPTGINAAGHIVGVYGDSSGMTHGFLAR